MSALRHKVFPRRFELAGSALHREHGNLVEPAVNPDFDFSHIIILLLCHCKDLRAHVFLAHPVGIVPAYSPQTHQIAPDAEAVAGEIEFVFPFHPGILLVPVNRISICKVLLQRQFAYRPLRYGDGLLPNVSAFSSYEFKSVAHRHIRAFRKRNVRTLKVEVPDFFERLFPKLRNIALAVHHSEDSAHCGRIAVRVLTAACGNFHRFGKVPTAVKQSYCHIGGIELGIYVETQEYALRASGVRAPFLLDFEPALFPVGRIFRVELAHIVNALIESALCRDAGKCSIEDGCRRVKYEGSRIQACHESTAVKTVPAVHYMSHGVCYLKCPRKHTRSH